VFVQDEASQLVPAVVAAVPGERVLDLCASPGGKTIAMAADMNDTGAIVASDVRPRRLTLLHDTVQTSGVRSVSVVRVPTDGPLPFAARFDAVLVDAPCSGLGTVRRDPDIRWRRREDDLPALARDQLDLFARAAEVVRPGGRLIYATCSSEPEENDGVIAAFIEARSDFRLVDLRASASGLRHSSISTGSSGRRRRRMVLRRSSRRSTSEKNTKTAGVFVSFERSWYD
jgi:16S rRNA (cytosine967-C5)-methyltransferase